MEDHRTMILAGEIGATRTRLAAFETEGQNLKLAVENSYRSPEHGGLPAVFVLVGASTSGMLCSQTRLDSPDIM